MIMLALEIPILLIFILIDIFRTRDLSFKERLKKRWFPYALVFLVFFVPRFINDYYFEEIHGRKFGRPEDEGNSEHHSIDYDRCLRNASLLTVGFCEWISGDYWKTVESECIDNQIFSGGLCYVKLKEKYQSLITDEQKIEYAKFLLKQLEQKQTDYSQGSIAGVASNISYLSSSIDVNRYILSYSFDRCYHKNIYNMCLGIYGPYRKVFPDDSHSILKVVVASLQLFNSHENPGQISKKREAAVKRTLNTFYQWSRKERTEPEIEERIKEIYENIDADIPKEVMFYYKKFLN